MEVPFARPSCRGDEGDAVGRVDRLRLGVAGPRVRAFEAAFAERVARPTPWRHDNCTTALQLALYVAAIGPGDEVDRAVDVVHRHGQRRVAERRDAGLRRRRPPHYNLDPGVGRARDHEPHEGDHAVHQLGLPRTWTPSSRWPTATA
jgi:perosamine synthetase